MGKSTFPALAASDGGDGLEPKKKWVRGGSGKEFELTRKKNREFTGPFRMIKKL